MQPDSKTLHLLLQMSDSQLWAIIRGVASKKGLQLAQTPPAPAEMQKLRRAIGELENKDMEKALSLLRDLEKKSGDKA